MASQATMKCVCDDPDKLGQHAFRVLRGDEGRHRHREEDGSISLLCHFCLELARFEDRARRALQEFDGPIRTRVDARDEWKVGDVVEWRGEYYRVVREVMLERDERPNAWGEDE